MTSSGVSTAAAISPDSGEHWAAEGAWRVAEGVWRIPLPLPMDGLKAVNVYVIETEEGLTLVDGGWAIPVARELLERCLRDIGFGFTDLRRFLVTHVHRDHFTLATVLGHEFGAEVSLGLEDKPAIDLLHRASELTESPFIEVLLTAGAHEVAAQWQRMDGEHELPDATIWQAPDVWMEGDLQIAVGTRTLDAVHTPGHTPGHYVFAEQDAGLLFAGDHVLPTITPSIGFVVPPDDLPLGRFLGSLRRVVELPDLRLLPAHGPVADSSHARAHELLEHHEDRLAKSLAAIAADGSTADEVARRIGWTRHERDYIELDVFSQGMAAMETKAHLELLVVRGQATARDGDGGIVFGRAAG